MLLPGGNWKPISLRLIEHSKNKIIMQFGHFENEVGLGVLWSRLVWFGLVCQVVKVNGIR